MRMIGGHRLTDAARKEANWLINSLTLSLELSTDIKDYFNSNQEILKETIQALGEGLRDAANVLGMEVKYKKETYHKLEGTEEFKFIDHFTEFVEFWGGFVDPYAVGKHTGSYYCGECTGVVFMTEAKKKEQTHLGEKVFSLDFLDKYTSTKRQQNEVSMEQAWKEFTKLF